MPQAAYSSEKLPKTRGPKAVPLPGAPFKFILPTKTDKDVSSVNDSTDPGVIPFLLPARTSALDVLDATRNPTCDVGVKECNTPLGFCKYPETSAGGDASVLFSAIHTVVFVGE